MLYPKDLKPIYNIAGDDSTSRVVVFFNGHFRGLIIGSKLLIWKEWERTALFCFLPTISNPMIRITLEIQGRMLSNYILSGSGNSFLRFFNEPCYVIGINIWTDILELRSTLGNNEFLQITKMKAQYEPMLNNKKSRGTRKIYHVLWFNAKLIKI